MTVTALDRDNFNGNLWDPDRSYTLIAEALDSDPLLAALTTLPTSRATVGFPHADMTGADWVAELGAIPSMSMNDTVPVIAPAKLAGKFLMSSESLDDTDFPLAQFIRAAISTSVVRKAARDVVYGVAGQPAAPAGFFGGLTNVAEATLRASVVKACASLIRSHGKPTTVILSPELWEAEVNRREALSVPSAGADGLFSDLGLTTRMSPALDPADALVLDTSKCYKVLRRDVRIMSSNLTSEAWNSDATSVRVVARIAGAVPRPAEAARSISVDTTP